MKVPIGVYWAIKKNSSVFRLAEISLNEPVVERIALVIPKVALATAASAVPASAPLATVVPVSVVPVVTATTNPVLPTSTKSLDVKTPLFVDSDEDEEPLPPPPPVPTAAPVVAVPVVAPAVTDSPKSDKLPREAKHEVDPIVLGIELEDPLYGESPRNTKAAIEREAATRYDSSFNEIYKAEGGRNRGWIKGTMEALIRARKASGGNIKELDKAKAAFPWSLVVEDKTASSFLDFLCVAKKIRVAVLCEETKIIHIYPASDKHDIEGEVPLYMVSSNGRPMNGPRDGLGLYIFAEKHTFTVMPCLSVLNALSKLTLEELETVGKGLGMAIVGGKKNERVAAIAAYKLKQRLVGNQ